MTLSAQASGKKKPPISVTFHMEATDIQSKKLAVEIDTPMGKKFMSKTPFIMTKDILAYQEFVSPHDESLYGMKLMLDRAGTNRLKMTTGQNSGKWVMCSINGQIVDMLYIDSQVNSNFITIWRGIDLGTVKHVNQLIPRIGESPDAWKERLKREKKTMK